MVACSVDSHFTHLAWMATPRTEGGLGKLDIPLLSDLTHTISKDYGVYLEENGHTLRGLFIIDPAGTLRCLVYYSCIFLCLNFNYSLPGKSP